MKRRKFLKFLGLVPLAAPAVVLRDEQCVGAEAERRAHPAIAVLYGVRVSPDQLRSLRERYAEVMMDNCIVLNDHVEAGQYENGDWWVARQGAAIHYGKIGRYTVKGL